MRKIVLVTIVTAIGALGISEADEAGPDTLIFVGEEITPMGSLASTLELVRRLNEHGERGFIEASFEDLQHIRLRLFDDSPESPESGAILFHQRLLVDSIVQENIQPLVFGGKLEEGVLKVLGEDVMELVYDVRNEMTPTAETPTLADAQTIDLEFILANDYCIELFADDLLLASAGASDNIADGSNLSNVRIQIAATQTGESVINLATWSQVKTERSPPRDGR